MKQDIKIDYKHIQTAHCENGVSVGIFSHYGCKISEPMVFGIGSGLFFGYLPFIKMPGSSIPLTTYRTIPGSIFKKAAKRLGITVFHKKFRAKKAGQEALDQMLAAGKPVCCRTGGYWLSYFPEGMRFHFNAHNIVIYGKEGDNYLISDPVFEKPVKCDKKNLLKARYALGLMAPKGRLYAPITVSKQTVTRAAIINGIKETCFVMRMIPFIGVHGIRFLANEMTKWESNYGKKTASHYLGNVIRVQEEIGTGGAGFRFIFAAFLQETAELFNDEKFEDFSQQMTKIGDTWRIFAALAAKNCKNRADVIEPYNKLSHILFECADLESELFRDLSKYIKSI